MPAIDWIAINSQLNQVPPEPPDTPRIYAMLAAAVPAGVTDKVNVYSSLALIGRCRRARGKSRSGRYRRRLRPSVQALEESIDGLNRRASRTSNHDGLKLDTLHATQTPTRDGRNMQPSTAGSEP